MFSIYKAKPGDQSSNVWKWSLSLVAENLTRRACASLAISTKQSDPTFKIIVYKNNEFLYTI
jgi:hypothetical protein